MWRGWGGGGGEAKGDGSRGRWLPATRTTLGLPANRAMSDQRQRLWACLPWCIARASVVARSAGMGDGTAACNFKRCMSLKLKAA